MALAGASWALGGCAFTDVPIYPALPTAARAKVPGPQRSVYVAEFVDQRHDPRICGIQKNGFGMRTANAFCIERPAHLVTELLAAGLRSAGFAVNRTDPARADVRIDGRLFQYFVEPVVTPFTFTPEADMHVRLLVSSRSGLLADRDFYVKADETSMVGTQSNFQKAHDAASSQLVLVMTHAVATLFNRYPELGTGNGAPPSAPRDTGPPAAPSRGGSS